MMVMYTLILLIIPFITTSKKWNPEDLIPQIPSWNYLNDPEELISDKALGAKINTNYLKVNKIYDKTDINLFIISDVADKYTYKTKDFLIDLHNQMEQTEAIDSKSKKEHHLFILILTKKNQLFIYPSSEKLQKLISNEQITRIQLEMKQVIEAKNYAKAIMFTFEKLHHVWKKFSNFPESKDKGKGYGKKGYNGSKGGDSWVKDLFVILPSIGILGLFVFVYYKTRKHRSAKDD